MGESGGREGWLREATDTEGARNWTREEVGDSTFESPETLSRIPGEKFEFSFEWQIDYFRDILGDLTETESLMKELWRIYKEFLKEFCSMEGGRLMNKIFVVGKCIKHMDKN